MKAALALLCLLPLAMSLSVEERSLFGNLITEVEQMLHITAETEQSGCESTCNSLLHGMHGSMSFMTMLCPEACKKGIEALHSVK